jgi:hypothetical protein
MQAAGIDAFGGEVRVLKLAAPASPAPDEVVISVRAAGVGNWDEFVEGDSLDRWRESLPFRERPGVADLVARVVPRSFANDLFDHPPRTRRLGGMSFPLRLPSASHLPPSSC